MTDPKLAPGVSPRTGASLDDSRAAVVDSFAMLSILSSAIDEIRLFEGAEGHRTPLFQIPLPRLSDLLPVLEWLLSAQPDHDPEFASAPVEQHANELLIRFAKATTEPGLPALHKWLQHLAREDIGLEAAKALLDTVRSFDGPPEAPASQRRMALASMALASDESSATRHATLDLFFDTLSGSCHAELSPAPEPTGQDPAVLRGEDVDQLRRDAKRFPAPEPAPPSDVPSDAYLTATAAAERLRVDKSTVTRRIAQNRLIGFRAFTHALRIPKDQFDGDDVVPGIPDVLALFTRSPEQPVDHRAAWAFLNSDLFRGTPHPRPIDRLRNAATTGATSTLLAELARTKESLDRGDHF